MFLHATFFDSQPSPYQAEPARTVTLHFLYFLTGTLLTIGRNTQTAPEAQGRPRQWNLRVRFYGWEMLASRSTLFFPPLCCWRPSKPFQGASISSTLSGPEHTRPRNKG